MYLPNISDNSKHNQEVGSKVDSGNLNGRLAGKYHTSKDSLLCYTLRNSHHDYPGKEK